MINFDTDKLIILFYPNNAGGKFLVNSLGLSDDALFQDPNQATKQLDGKWSQNDKFAYLDEKLKEVTSQWLDLNLGCRQLFGVSTPNYVKVEDPKKLTFNPIIERVTNDGTHYFFLVTHNHTILEKLLEVWKNAQVIVFENCENFIELYQRDMFWWDTIRKPHWPASFPVTETDLELIDPLVLSEIKNTLPKFAYSNDDSFTFWRKHLEDKHQHEVLARLFVATTDRGITEWNTDWYLSRETTITEIKNLYDKFGLSNYNEKLIGKYFDHWTSTLNRLKDSRNENST